MNATILTRDAEFVQFENEVSIDWV